MSEVFRCDKCRTAIAVGEIQSGALLIRCKRCGHKTLVVPDKKALVA